jgi:Lon protease-like protein
MSSLRLPIFPLGLVLFPGASLPLHLFEPRYRQLIKDVGTRGRFGIVLAMPGVADRELPRGHAGCIAEVMEIEMLPDGRSNIVVVGRERFALERFVDDPAPYHVADVLPLNDTPADAPVALAVAADELAARFKRIVDAVRVLSDDDTAPPPLPEDPARLPFAIGALIDLDLAQRQLLLAERSPAQRLAHIDGVLRKALPDLELRAAMKAR